MCWIETQQSPCGCATGVMPCGPHCKVAAGAWSSLPFVGWSISALAFLMVGLGVRQENWCFRGLFLAVQFTLAARICSLLEQRVSFKTPGLPSGIHQSSLSFQLGLRCLLARAQDSCLWVGSASPASPRRPQTECHSLLQQNISTLRTLLLVLSQHYPELR